MITTTDKGTGIVENDFPFVFEGFYRTDKFKNKNTGGSGIRMAVSKSIIEVYK